MGRNTTLSLFPGRVPQPYIACFPRSSNGLSSGFLYGFGARGAIDFSVSRAQRPLFFNPCETNTLKFLYRNKAITGHAGELWLSNRYHHVQSYKRPKHPVALARTHARTALPRSAPLSRCAQPHAHLRAFPLSPIRKRSEPETNVVCRFAPTAVYRKNVPGTIAGLTP